MAKRQTRRSVSIDRPRYDKLVEFSTEHAIPMAQIVSQAIDAVFAGTLQMKPAVDPHDVGVGTLVRTGKLVPREQPEKNEHGHIRSFTVGPKPTPPAFGPGTFCAVCTDDLEGQPLWMEPLGKDGGLVNVCDRCKTESPRSGRYSFGASHRGGIGEGNRRTGSGV